jgi:hypothetical protein
MRYERRIEKEKEKETKERAKGKEERGKKI